MQDYMYMILQDVHILYKVYIYYTRLYKMDRKYIRTFTVQEVHCTLLSKYLQCTGCTYMLVLQKNSRNIYVACTYKVCTVQNMHVVYSVLHRMFCVLYRYLNTLVPGKHVYLVYLNMYTKSLPNWKHFS